MVVEGWRGLGMKVSWWFGFAMALPASQKFDGTAEVGWLFNGVTLRWIDVRKGIWVGWKVRREVFGRILVTFRVLGHGLPAILLHTRLTIGVLVRLCQLGNEFWCRLVAYPCSLPRWIVSGLNFCIVLYLCLLLCCVLFALIVVDFGQSLCVCLGMPCWWDMPLLGGKPTLRWRRVIANWTLPPSGRMRIRVAGVNSGRPHTGIAVFKFISIEVPTRSSDIIFPVSDRFLKALDVGSCALRHASMCLFVYVDVSETPFGLFSFILKGFRFYVPPMYFTTVLN